MRIRGALLMAISLAPLATFLAVSPSAWSPAPSAALAATDPDATLVLISTPDEPYVGGRHFEMDRFRVITNTSEELFIGFVRQHADGAPLQDDPAWGVKLSSPSTLELNTSYQLDGSETDPLRFTDDLTWYENVCPGMTGSVQLHELDTDIDGAVSALSASFVLHCTQGDSLFGALTVGAATPAELDSAQHLVDAESQFPTLVSEYVDGYAETVAIDVHNHKLLMRWDTPSGFRCVDASVDRDGDGLISYSGRDDTWLVGDVDKSLPHTVTVEFGSSWDERCEPVTLFSNESTVLPTESRLNEVRLSPSGDRLVLAGRILNVVPGYSEPARFIEVTAKGRRADGEVLVLGSTSTDVDGRFRVVVDARRAERVWAAVAPGAEPAAPESFRSYWYHFGDRSPGHRSPIN